MLRVTVYLTSGQTLVIEGLESFELAPHRHVSWKHAEGYDGTVLKHLTPDHIAAWTAERMK